MFTFFQHASAQPGEITTFSYLLSALTSGRHVRAVISYAQCTLKIDSVEQKSPDAIGGMALEPFEYFARGAVRNPKAYVAASETHLISHPRYGYVNNYVRMRVFEDGSVEIVARYLKPATFDVVMDETFLGSFGKDGQQGPVRFFEDK
jgi:hypothetical protein